MSEIREAIYAISVISVASGCINVFSPDGRMKKYVKYIVSLVVIASLLRPISYIFTQIPSYLDSVENITEQSQNTNDSSGMENAVEEGIKNVLMQKFSLKNDSFNVHAELKKSENSNLVEKIEIRIKDRESFYLCEEIKLYLKSTFGCEISVIQDFGEEND